VFVPNRNQVEVIQVTFHFYTVTQFSNTLSDPLTFSDTSTDHQLPNDTLIVLVAALEAGVPRVKCVRTQP
jgi:hypothetical protein